MKKIPAIFLALMAVSPAMTHAEIYKWVDSSGTVRYSDSPPPSNMQRQPLHIKNSAPEPKPKTNAANNAAAVGADTTAAQTDTQKRKQDADAAQAKADAAAAEQKIKQQNCIAAKTNLQNFKQGMPVYKAAAPGEASVVDEAATANGLAQAQKDVDAYCK